MSHFCAFVFSSQTFIWV